MIVVPCLCCIYASINLIIPTRYFQTHSFYTIEISGRLVLKCLKYQGLKDTCWYMNISYLSVVYIVQGVSFKDLAASSPHIFSVSPFQADCMWCGVAETAGNELFTMKSV